MRGSGNYKNRFSLVEYERALIQDHLYYKVLMNPNWKINPIYNRKIKIPAEIFEKAFRTEIGNLRNHFGDVHFGTARIPKLEIDERDLYSSWDLDVMAIHDGFIFTENLEPTPYMITGSDNAESFVIGTLLNRFMGFSQTVAIVDIEEEMFEPGDFDIVQNK